MSDAVRTQIGIVEEVTIGTTPTSPAFETLRVTVPNLTTAKQSKVSNELRADRQITDRITVGFQAGGDIGQEVSYGAADSLIRGAMQSEWAWAPVRDNAGTADSNITDVTTTDVVIVATNSTQYRSGVFAVGHLVRTSGFTNSGNNALRRAGAGTGALVIKLASGTAESAPPAAARAKAVGFEGASGDITATSTGLGSTALDLTTLGLVAGMWLWIGGPSAGTTFATAACRGWARISSASGAISATGVVCDVLPTGWATDAGSSKTIRVYFGDYIRNGTTRRSYTVEQQFQDLTVPTYEYYKGMVPTIIEFDVKSQDILTGKTTFMGMTVADPSSSRVAGATDVAAPTNDVMNSSDNVGSVLVNGAELTGNYVTSLNLSLDNAGRRNTSIGSRFSRNIKSGRASVMGKVEMYYDDATVLTYIRNSTAVGFFFPISDPTATKALLFDMPRVKFGDGSPTVPGIETDRMLPTDFQALRHPTFGYTIQIQRVEEYNT